MRPAMPKACSTGSLSRCSAPTRRRRSVTRGVYCHPERSEGSPRRSRAEALQLRLVTLSGAKGLVGRGVLLLVALLALAALALRPGTLAATGPTVSDEGVTNRFPDGIEFRVSASGGRPLEKVSLRYTVLPDGTTARAVPDFEPGTRVSTSLTLAGGDNDVYLPPGTRIRYHWEVEDADGNTASTPEATVVYEDVRFDWRKLEGNGIVLYYYSGSDEDAQAMLDVARDAIAQASDLLNARVEFPVNVRTYDSVDDMRPALQRRSESYESQIITAGVRVSSDTVLVLGNVSFSTLRHELTHVVTAVAGEGPFGTLPAWLDEGTAVYGQSNPEVYGDAWSLVSYLVDTYGPEKFARLFAEIKGGKRTDQALTAVYGFDQDGLEDEWRASLGLPPRETPPPQERP